MLQNTHPIWNNPHLYNNFWRHSEVNALITIGYLFMKPKTIINGVSSLRTLVIVGWTGFPGFQESGSDRMPKPWIHDSPFLLTYKVGYFSPNTVANMMELNDVIRLYGEKTHVLRRGLKPSCGSWMRINLYPYMSTYSYSVLFIPPIGRRKMLTTNILNSLDFLENYLK